MNSSNDFWTNAIENRLNDICSAFGDTANHRLLNEQQQELITKFTDTLNKAQQDMFTEIDEGQARIRFRREDFAYRTGLADGIRLMCSL